jgi:SNF2-related domain
MCVHPGGCSAAHHAIVCWSADRSCVYLLSDAFCGRAFSVCQPIANGNFTPCSDMGLGKTRTCTAFLAGMLHTGTIKRALVVVPKSLIVNWQKEMAWAGLEADTVTYYEPCMRATAIERAREKSTIMITSYGLTTKEVHQQALTRWAQRLSARGNAQCMSSPTLWLAQSASAPLWTCTSNTVHWHLVTLLVMAKAPVLVHGAGAPMLTNAIVMTKRTWCGISCFWMKGTACSKMSKIRHTKL